MMIDLNTSKIRKDIEDIQGSGFTSSDSLVHAGLKKVQRGEVTMAGTTADATIPIAVDMDKTFVKCSFYFDMGSSTDPARAVDLEASILKWKLTTTTNIHFQRGSTIGSAYIAWEVIEWK